MTPRWTLSELTELDLRFRPSTEISVPPSWEPDASGAPSEVLRTWLAATREEDPEAARLAQLAVRGEAWLRLALFCGSVLTGMGAALGLLRAGGQDLINISTYLGILVGGQLLLLLLLGVSSFWIRSRGSLLQQAALPLVIRELPAPNSLELWRLRIFASFQLGGLGFNLGVLAASFWKIATFDLAFGWATTLQLDPQAVTNLFSALATPWGGAFAPTLSQVEQSRIILLEGFSQLTAEATAAWWPFLLMCVLFYGALPRLILFGWSRLRLHLRLSHPSFQTPELMHLVKRLTHAPLQFAGNVPSASGTRGSFELSPLEPSGPLSVILPEDIKSYLDEPAFLAHLRASLGLELSSDNAAGGVLQVQEVWQPPLEESLLNLRALRNRTGPDAEILLLAVGLPGSQGLPQAPRSKDVFSWKQKLAQLKDPGLGLLEWEPPA